MLLSTYHYDDDDDDDDYDSVVMSLNEWRPVEQCLKLWLQVQYDKEGQRGVKVNLHANLLK